MSKGNSKTIYKVIFHNQGQTFEVYAREVSQGAMFAFVEIADMVFGERSSLVVDPAEEKLKGEFSGVKRTYIPLHSIVRIDEVEKEGTAKIHAGTTDKGKVTPFPVPVTPPAGSAD